MYVYRYRRVRWAARGGRARIPALAHGCPLCQGGAPRCPPLLGMRYARLRLLCERMQPALRGVGGACSAAGLGEMAARAERYCYEA